MSTSPGAFPGQGFPDLRQLAPGSIGSSPEDRLPPLEKVQVAADVVVEHGDVPGGLVGDGDLVPVLHQLPEHPTHGDDVVVGMRGEDQDPPAQTGSLLLPRILAMRRLNTSPFTASADPMLGHEGGEVVVPVVLRGQAKDGPLHPLAEPDHGLRFPAAVSTPLHPGARESPPG